MAMTSLPLVNLLSSYQRELQCLVVIILSWLLWKPVRVTINHWRLHRRQRKYPQLVLCRVESVPSYGRQRRSRDATGRMVWNLMQAILHSLVTFLLVLPLKCIQFVVKTWTSDKPHPQSPLAAPRSEPSSTPTQAVRRTSPPLSVLRKAGSSSSVHSRVEFAEHSNGRVRTERRYYLPHAQPNQSIQPANTPSPPAVQSKRSEPETMFLTPEWPSGRPNPKRQLVHTQKPPNSYNQIMPRGDTLALAVNHSSAPSRLIVQTPLSEQMRKRRLDEQRDQSSVKRSSLAGRVTLAGTQARIIGSGRTFLNKREREAREDRILKDLNSKRIKTKDVATVTNTSASLKLAPVPTTESNGSQNGVFASTTSTLTQPAKEKDTAGQVPDATSTGFSIGSLPPSSETKAPAISFNIPTTTPSAAPETKSSNSAQGAQPPPFKFDATTQGSSSDAPATSTTTGFSFGGTSDATTSSNNVPAGPAFQFGAPASAPSSQEPAQGSGFSFGSTSTSASGAPAPAFQFGAAAPAAEAQAPATGFSFGNTSTTTTATTGAPAPAFQFGAAAPASEAQPPATGFSFGNTSTTTTTTTGAPAPAFQFGAATPASEAQPPATGFSFGNTSATTGAPAPAFQFGTKDPVPAFGAPPASGFSFGNTSSTTSGTGTLAAQAPTMPSFGFDNASTTLPTGAGSAVGGGGASARRRAKAKAGRRR